MIEPIAVYWGFETLERKAAEIYFELRKRFSAQPRAAVFWREVGCEELEHAEVLRYCREHHLFNAGGVTAEQALRIEAAMRGALDTISKPGLTLTQAFEIALMLESSEIDEIYEKLTFKLHSPYPFLRDAFQANYRDHLMRFARSARSFGVDLQIIDGFKALAARHVPIAGQER